MKVGFWLIVLWSIGVATTQGQQIGAPNSASAAEVISSGMTFTVQGTTPERERLLRAQIATMQPAVLPHRILFVPHWQYAYATKMFHLHVPTGMSSKMFTHLPSASVFVDNDFYGGDEWLGHWIAHELGHLELNNADENQAERAAAVYRSRLKHNH